MIRNLSLGLLFWVGSWVGTVQAQLAITEVMSEAGLESDPGFNRPDFWELTNFGQEAVALDGFSFSDERKTDLLVPEPFINLVIQPGESVIFFRARPGHSSVTNAQRFREWWGEANLPPELQIRTWENPGFNGDTGGDELWLWDPGSNVVDHVKFGEARVGRSFVYELENGIFGVISTPDLYKSFVSALGTDLGSPGWTAGTVSLGIVQQPVAQTVDAGSEAGLSVVACGLPRPCYQWLTNGQELPGGNAASLVLSNVQPEQAGSYAVRVYNGIEQITSQTVSLTVNTDPSPPSLARTPSDTTVFVGQTAVFSAWVRGFPSPRAQWESNGVDIAGATRPTLAVPGTVLAMSGDRYTLRLWNEWGQTNASATLTVMNRPCLRFTEVMANPVTADSSGHFDWFELSNCDTNTVNLQGYRIYDTPSLTGGFTIAEPVLIRPGESVVFVEEMTPNQFWFWWGVESGLPGVQVITYHGFALRELGEMLSLWNPSASDPFDTVATVLWARALLGVSLECQNECELHGTYGCNGECLVDSVPGRNGAFHAAVNADVGSPGWTANPAPRLLGIECFFPDTHLKCQVMPGRNYRLLSTATLAGAAWTERGTYAGLSPILWIWDSGALTDPVRFYRLEELP